MDNKTKRSKVKNTVTGKRINNRIFVDMDGTIAQFVPGGNYKEKDYFLNLLPNFSMLNAIKILIGLGYDVYILSAVEGERAKQEKMQWLESYLSEISPDHVIFTSCDKDKAEFISDFCHTDVLLDDYSKNLIPWAKKAIGIKCVNGINWNNGSWYGYSVHINSDAQFIANTIRGILQIEDEKVA